MKQLSLKVRLATVNDAAALARLNYEFNGGEQRQAAEIAVYIKQAYRRKGAATALLDLLENELSRRSVVSIKILTGNTNDSALQTYENNGYARESEAVLIKELC